MEWYQIATIMWINFVFSYWVVSYRINKDLKEEIEILNDIIGQMRRIAQVHHDLTVMQEDLSRQLRQQLRKDVQ